MTVQTRQDIGEARQITSLPYGKHSIAMIGASTTSDIAIDVSRLTTLEITDGTVIVAPGVNLSTFTALPEEQVMQA